MQPRERLTAKELQVAALVWEGLTNREIATSIGTTEQVIKNYLRNTFDKLGVWSHLELAIYCRQPWRRQLAARTRAAAQGGITGICRSSVMNLVGAITSERVVVTRDTG